MEKGCILLSRSIYESAIWSDNPHVLKLFLYLIGHARFKEGCKKYHGFEVNRGEVLTSLKNISDDNEYFENTMKKWSKQKVSRMLDVLEKQGYIKRLSDTYGTHISICNYNKYQDIRFYKQDSSVTPADSSGNNSNNGNKGNKGNKKLYVPKKEHLELAKKLAALVLENNPNDAQLNNGKREKTEISWSNDFRLMIEQDNREIDDIVKIIKFSQADDFLIPNIRSASKFRKRFDEMSLREKMEGKKSGSSSNQAVENFINS